MYVIVSFIYWSFYFTPCSSYIEVDPRTALPLRSLYTDPDIWDQKSEDAVVHHPYRSDDDPNLDVSARLIVGFVPLIVNITTNPLQWRSSKEVTKGEKWRRCWSNASRDSNFELIGHFYDIDHITA